ncbi:MAG TPA: transporter [Xanthobacteraceae bacterium]|nr:transporter [Xanthobacteraceae bacterium]
MILIPDEAPAGPGHETVLRLERLAGPYYVFRDRGMEVVLASPEGGSPWIRPSPSEGEPLSGVLGRFRADRPARDALNDTLSLDQIAPEDFAGAFCIGAPGAIWRDAHANRAAEVIAAFLTAGRPVAAVPAGIDLAPMGSDEGLVIIADSDGAVLKAAHALLAALDP